MEEQVAERLRQTRTAVLENPRSAAAWGRFGMVAHAHELWDVAEFAYRRAWSLDRSDERWPYYLGDVLSVVGTDLAAAEEAFRSFLELDPDYGPGHMRLGQILVADGRPEEAGVELQRALELAPDLQPAQVALAQVRLVEGELEAAASLLEGVLSRSPRHGQALATLGQVYMRQGRRQDARKIAVRARDPASYNLYSDPLMSEVVSEGRSSVVIWDRAKSFLENGNYEQAALGLQQVVVLRPSDPDVHFQLAIAYGSLGELQRAEYHLERTLELAPEKADARVRLAAVYLELQRPEESITHLRRALELDPDNPQPRWLLGRALLRAGDLDGGIAVFEQTEALGLEAPAWAHNEWGSALAQAGRADVALEHFRQALAAEPANAQALFYIGLILEARGKIDEATERYCQSLVSEPSSPASARLRSLGRSCA